MNLKLLTLHRKNKKMIIITATVLKNAKTWQLFIRGAFFFFFFSFPTYSDPSKYDI